MRRTVPLVLLGLGLAFGACSRRQPPPSAAPAPTPARPGDTTAGRQPPATPPGREPRDTAQTPPDTGARPPTEVVIPPGQPPEETPERCILDLPNLPGTRAFVTTNPVTRQRVTIVSGGIRGRCRNQPITIEADSAESYEATDTHFLFGNVRYREPRVAIDADRAVYHRAQEHLLLQENVHVELQQSPGTIDGNHVEYFRAARGVRDQARVVAYNRPTLTYIETDSAGRPLPPAVLRADVIIGEGDSTFYATRRVVLTRDSLVATGDSAVLDGTRNRARLMINPVIESRDQEPYTLRGRVIDLYGAARRVDRVVAIDSGRVDSEQLTLVADTIDLRVSDGRLDRAIAFGTSGAHASTPEREVIADSLDVIMPGQRLRELRAIGNAFAEADPDTTRVRSDERDWIRGDTIVALFDTTVATDTAATPDTGTTRVAAQRDTSTRVRMERLVATGNASAFYHIASERGEVDRPGINYARGRVIQLLFADGEVERVYVIDQAVGLYLEPKPDSARAVPADSTRPPVRPPSPGRRRP